MLPVITGIFTVWRMNREKHDTLEPHLLQPRLGHAVVNISMRRVDAQTALDRDTHFKKRMDEQISRDMRTSGLLREAT